MGLFRLAKLPLARWPRYLTLIVLPPVAAVVGASFYLDSQLYGAATLVPLNFLRFNVLEGKSRIFGEQAWHWNFSQGLPAVLGAALPAALCGFWRPFGGGGGGSMGEGGEEGGEIPRIAGDRRRLGWLAVWFLGETGMYHLRAICCSFVFAGGGVGAKGCQLFSLARPPACGWVVSVQLMYARRCTSV